MKDFLRQSDRIFEGILQNIFGNDIAFLLAKGLLETIYMTGFSIFFAIIFGLPLGIFLTLTSKNSIRPMPILNRILGWLVNTIRSFPFMVLIIALLPFSGYLIGTSTGSSAAIIALSVAAVPFIARLFEGALSEVSRDLIEAAQSMGAGNFVIVKMMLAEAAPSLLNSVVITTISLIGYCAMAGIVGGGGLGDLAYRLGFVSFRDDVLILAVVATIVLVQVIQSTGDFMVKKIRKNR